MSKFLDTIFIFSLICGQVQAVSMDDPGIKQGVEIVPISRDDLSINRGAEIVPISLDDPVIKRGIELMSISRDDPSINRGVEVVPISLDDPNINPGIELVPISLGDPNINLGIAIVPISLNGPDIRRGIEIIAMEGSDRKIKIFNNASESVGEESDQDNEAGEKLTEAKILDIVRKARREIQGDKNKLQQFFEQFSQREKIDIFKHRYEHDKTILHLAAEKGVGAFEEIISLSYTLPREKRIDFLNAEDDQGMTAFHHAVRSGNAGLVEDFIYSDFGNDIDFNAVDNQGRNAAHHAMLLKSSISMKAMDAILFSLRMKAQVDMKAQDNHGKNILHYAVRRGESGVIRSAALYCRDIKATDNQDKNPFHYAAEMGVKEMHFLNGILLEFRSSEQEITKQDIKDALGMFDKEGNTPQDIAVSVQELIWGISQHQ